MFNIRDFSIGAAVGAVAGVAIGVVYSQEIKGFFAEDKPAPKKEEKPADAPAPEANAEESGNAQPAAAGSETNG